MNNGEVLVVDEALKTSGFRSGAVKISGVEEGRNRDDAPCANLPNQPPSKRLY
jgi:hypothetical protein